MIVRFYKKKKCPALKDSNGFILKGDVFFQTGALLLMDLSNVTDLVFLFPSERVMCMYVF